MLHGKCGVKIELEHQCAYICEFHAGNKGIPTDLLRTAFLYMQNNIKYYLNPKIHCKFKNIL